MTNVTRKGIGIAAALLAGGLAASSASAYSISTGFYYLDNHPAGAEAEPYYGLRLDGLLSGDDEDIYTFDFENNGAAMFMDYDGATIHIYGQAWGGLDDGDGYVSPTMWEIDFTYDVSEVTATGEVLAGVGGDKTNTGYIRRIADNAMWGLTDVGSGAYGYTFALDHWHRGFPGISGFGWVNHYPFGTDPADSVHMYYSDWLFTARLPEPGTLALLGMGLIGMAMGRRRRH